MNEMEVDEIKNNIYNSLLKNKSKEMTNEDQGGKSKRVVFQEKLVILNKGVTLKTAESVSKPEPSEHEKSKEKKERSRPPTKVVVRRLPPTMTLDTFTDNVSPLPEHDFIYFVRADISLGVNAYSRAYINFVNMDDLLTFYEQFDNYVFMDNKGNEYPAVVEFAPFQRVPKKRPGRKKDPKVGTLKEDPAFLSFVASLKEKKDTSSMKQASAEHLLALTTESSNKKDVTTPLLEFIKQRRAERQRLREEKREERKRKELERKRLKEEERKRRKDGDSVLKVLKNPEHEDKEETGKFVKEKERSQQILKKREEDRKHKEKERKERRDLKGRDLGLKPFRDERPKQQEGRMPRKSIDELSKKPGVEHGLGDEKNSLEHEKSGQVKDTDTRKMQASPRDAEPKKSEKLSSHSRENDRHVRDVDPKRSYRDYKKIDKNQGHYDYRRGSYSNEQRKFSHVYNEPDSRKKIGDHKSNLNKSIDMPLEARKETSRIHSYDDPAGKKWELLGAKPKRNPTEGDDKIESSNIINSEIRPEPEHPIILKKYTDVCNKAEKEVEKLRKDAPPGILLRRRNSLECESQNDRNSKEKPRRQTSLDSETFLKSTSENSSKRTLESKTQEFEKCADTVVRITRRNSLDSDARIETAPVVSSDSCHSEIIKEESQISCKSVKESKEHAMNCVDREEKNINDHKTDEPTSETSKSNELQRTEDAKSSDGSDSSKRDPRAERRIRNKDRPSIEIYRPGMGRFSMQRKEREKHAVVGSSTEQDSPSNSPSPTPSARPTSTSKVAKSNQELRSMTFKRSVSREK